jgi:hypothetical protein
VGVLKYRHALRLLLVFKVDTHKKGSDATIRTHFFFRFLLLCGPCPPLQAFLFYLPVTQVREAGHYYHRHVCLFLMVQVGRLVLSACVMCMVPIWGSCAAAVSGGGMGAREGVIVCD